ncbi:divisome protein SepX/GlpR [Nocardia altamirensis]|uniref:divisome protein SepX/GlpR n=1 Tax=Nocardia altamirensis TaxID=472158 RepID=UPI00083FE0D4|nr:gephyrin-like molybdotransferase receptor GlpR [Nocardia altamirensis]
MPNSILWIGLVVLWVFVLFPILADRHPRIRRTTDAALATRVLHRGDAKRRTKSGPAAGHETDPNWRPRRAPRKYAHSDDAEDRMTTPADPETEGELPAIAGSAATNPEPDIADAELDDTAPDDVALDDADLDDADLDEVAAESVSAGPEDDADDEDADDEAAAKNVDAADDDDVGEERTEPAAARIPPARAPARVPIDDDLDYDDLDDDYTALNDDYDDDLDYVPSRRGRGGFDPEADAIARAARYTFRQRAVLGLVLVALLCGGLAVAINPLFWWGTGLACLVAVGYLAYLRKQVRMEEDIRRRRAARLSRAEQRGEPRQAPATRASMDRDTARALRRRSALLEVDDEDPMFDHLDPFDPATARALRDRTGGGDMRRAAGA